MTAKDFKAKLKQDPKTVSPSVDPIKETLLQPDKEAVIKNKTTQKKVGRPKSKTEECKTINIAVPVSMLEKINIAKLPYKDNLTLYVNTVIEKDLELNFDKYKTFADMQKNFK